MERRTAQKTGLWQSPLTTGVVVGSPISCSSDILDGLCVQADMVARLVLLATLGAFLQATPASDVSTIRVSKAKPGNTDVEIDQSHFEATGVDAHGLIQLAFNEPKDMIFGLPAWAEQAQYDIRAKSTEENAETLKKISKDQVRGMLQGLLADRFGLKTHIEEREVAVFELVFVRPSPAFKKTQEAQGYMSINNRHMVAKGVTIEQLAKVFTGEMHRPVVDRTGLSGAYNVDLHWQQDNDAAREDLSAPPILVTALQEQLGLKLRSGKAKVPVLVVDQIVEPSAN
jgi:uncharacterized protein (TIGR03435 family)